MDLTREWYLLDSSVPLQARRRGEGVAKIAKDVVGQAVTLRDRVCHAIQDSAEHTSPSSTARTFPSAQRLAEGRRGIMACSRRAGAR